MTPAQMLRHERNHSEAGAAVREHFAALRKPEPSYTATPGGEYVRHPAYAAIKAEFPIVKIDGGGMTPSQGRVCFHQERLFRSTGAGGKAHAQYTAMCREAGLPASIERWTRAECCTALRLMERAAKLDRMALVRDVRTDWEQLDEKR